MRFSRLVGDFSRARRGAVALVFGISVLPLLLALGSAIDYGRAFAVRSSLQTTLDTALLATGGGDIDDVAATATVRRYFDANWSSDYGARTTSITVNSDRSGHVRGTASAAVPTTLMSLIGVSHIAVDVAGEIATATQDVEIVLVMDTTGSMAGAKLDALKASARALVDAVFEPANARGHVKIGLVPFSEYVNVGLSRRNRPWMSVPLDSRTTRQWCRDEAPVTSRTNCRMETYTGNNDGVPYSYQYEACDYTYGDPVRVCSDVTDSQTWYGCAGSRGYPLDVRDGSYSTPIPGLMNTACASELTPLTNDVDQLHTGIDALVATGETYIPTGLFWGWTMLSSTEPFDEAVAYGTRRGGRDVRKVMVLMTDGANTRSPDYPWHWATDAPRANALTSELCGNVKGMGIDVYTVAFEVSDVTIKNILRGCASSPLAYYDATDASQLSAAFSAIARQMTALHLAR